MSTDLGHPIAVQQTLEEIEEDLAVRQLAYESAARAWFAKQGQIAKDRAISYRRATGNSTDRRAAADEEHGEDGAVEQAEYEALRAVVKVLETRATICQSLLKSQGRS